MEEIQEPQPIEIPQPLQKIPWENRKELGFFNALFKTIVQVISHPTDFFRAMSKDEDYTEPLFFGAMTSLFTMLISYIWVVPLVFIMPMMLASFGEDPTSAFAGSFGMGFNMIFQLIFGLIMIVPGLFINAGILHLGVMIFGANKGGYVNTFKAVCYSSAAGALGVIPIVGWILALYKIAVEIIGLREAHETTTGKAILAWIFVPAVCCLLAALVIIPFAGAIIAALASIK
jgi:hypothetical protein